MSILVLFSLNLIVARLKTINNFTSFSTFLFFLLPFHLNSNFLYPIQTLDSDIIHHLTAITLFQCKCHNRNTPGNREHSGSANLHRDRVINIQRMKYPSKEFCPYIIIQPSHTISIICCLSQDLFCKKNTLIKVSTAFQVILFAARQTNCGKRSRVKLRVKFIYITHLKTTKKTHTSKQRDKQTLCGAKVSEFNSN